MKAYLTVLLLFALASAAIPQEPASNIKDMGYYNYSSFGLLVGNSDTEQGVITSLLMEHNYQFSPYFSAGVVTGLESFDVNLLPLGINIKLQLPRLSNAVLFAGFGAGRSIALEAAGQEPQNGSHTKGGRFFMGELGYVFPSQRTHNIFIAVGYRYQRFSFVRNDLYRREIKRTTIYNRLSLRLGIRLY